MKKIKKVFKKTFHILWLLTELFFACVIVVAGLTFYILHTSPQDGRFLMPEIEKQVLPKDSGYHIQSDSVIISSDWQKPGLIQIDIENLKILRPDGAVEVALPKALISYDFWHLITLNYMPSMILLKEPYVHLVLTDKGVNLQTAKDDRGQAIDLNWIRRLVRHFLSFRRIDIVNADFSIQDVPHNRTFHFLDGTISFHRWFHFLEKIHFDTSLKSEGIDTRFILEADLNRWNKTLSFQAGIPSINLSTLGYLLSPVKDADFDTQISLKGILNVSPKIAFVPDMVQKINFNVQSLSNGTLNLPEPLTNVYPVKSLNINGVVGQGCRNVKIASSSATLSYGTQATLNVDVKGVADFLKTNDIAHIQTTLKSTVTNVPTAKIGAVWPRGVGTSSHDWVAEHLSKGFAETADFTLYFKGDELTDLYGDILVKGMTVDYLPPMPKIDDVSGHVYLYPDKVHIVTDRGHAGHLQLLSADLWLTDVDIDPSWANIKLKIEGPADEALKLLDSPPLEFVKPYGIDPKKVSGNAQIETELNFRLDTDIEPKDVKASVQAILKNITLSLNTPPLQFTKGDLTLTVQDNVLNVEGKAELFKVPLHLKWTEHFFPTNGIRSVYDISASISSDDLLTDYPDIENWIKGKIGMHLQATQQAQTDLLSGQLLLDATDAYLYSHLLNVVKKEDVPLSVNLAFQNVSSKQGLVQMDVYGQSEGKDILLKGDAVWAKELTVNLEKVQMGQNDFSFYWQNSPLKNALTIKGKSMDLSGIFHLPESFHWDIQTDEKIRSILLDVHLNQLILNEQKPIHNLIISGQRDLQLWHSFHAQADLSSPFILIYDNRKKQFQGGYSDFGDFMDYVGLSKRFDGGAMSLVADQKDNGDLLGDLQVSKIQFKEPGFLMQALTILGIVDAFLGKDMVFDEMKIPFILTPIGDIQLDEAYAAGTSLGITFTGDIQDGKLNLSGAVVPAYGINSLPGKIPLIGYLFRNSTGGGLINVPYSVKGSLFVPETTFHPLGTITPGVLGKLF